MLDVDTIEISQCKDNKKQTFWQNEIRSENKTQFMYCIKMCLFVNKC